MKNFLVFLSLNIIFSGFGRAESTVFRVPIGVELQHLDMSEAEDFVTVRVLMNLGWGLVQLDKNLKALPALAKTWQVSDDQKIYTFILKKNFWSNGTPIKAQDFVRGLENTFAPKTIAKLAGPLKEVVESFKTIDDNTLEIHLRHPANYFLSLLALPISFPEPDIKDFRITPQTPTSGPYTLKTMNREKIVLLPNPKSESPARNTLEFRVIQEQTAALALYEKNELDFIDKVPSSDYDRISKSSDLSLDLKKAPWLATYYIGFNLTHPPFSSLKARRAFAESINRKDVLKLIRDPQVVASSLVPHPLETSQLEFGPKYNLVQAKKEWSEVLNAPASVDFYFDSQDKNNLIAARIQKEIEDNLQVKLNLKGMEWKSYLSFLKDPNTGPALYRFAWLSTFPDPLSHLEVFKSGNPNNYSGYRNEKYDKLIDLIAVIPGGKERTKLITQAQKILLTDDVVLMPLFHYMQYLLIRNRWKGLDLSPMGIVYFHQAHL